MKIDSPSDSKISEPSSAPSSSHSAEEAAGAWSSELSQDYPLTSSSIASASSHSSKLGRSKATHSINLAWISESAIYKSIMFALKQINGLSTAVKVSLLMLTVILLTSFYMLQNLTENKPSGAAAANSSEDMSGHSRNNGNISSSDESQMSLEEDGQIRSLVQDFKLIDSKGEQSSLSQWRGHVVVLNFWASWCAACLIEFPSLEALQNRYNPQGLQVLAVNLDENQEGQDKAKDLWIAQKHSFPSYYDPKKEIARQFDIEVLPANVVIDKKGRLVFSGIGASDWMSEETQSLISELLSEPSP